MRDKKRAAKFVDTLIGVTIAGIFIGIMLAIWIGAIGTKILLSSIVLLVVFCTVYGNLDNGQQSQDGEEQQIK